MFGLDLAEQLERQSWQWVLARCYHLIELPDTLSRREALTRGI